MLRVTPLRAFRDNYMWLLLEGRWAAIVDPGDAGPVLKMIKEQGLELVAVLITHHHWDHVNGIQALLDAYPVPVYGPAREAIPGRTQALEEGDEVHLALMDLRLRVIEVPGHTAGAIAYHGAKRVFTGDTLFTAGCGRLFEGTAAQMYRSLSKLAALPPNTEIYCGHEYTLSNLAFASAVEPENAAIKSRVREAQAQRDRDLPTVPSILAVELQSNPFLRCQLPGVQAAAERHCGRSLRPGAEVLGIIRSWKDSF